MAERYLTCPLCGFAFDRRDTLCSHGCPLGALCSAVRCPSCEYEFTEQPKAVPVLGRLFRRRPARRRLPDDVRTLEDLPPGLPAEVLCVGSASSPRPNALAVFGLVPGVEVTLIQRRPSCVVRVGETDLALDPEIAREVVVRTEPASA